MAFRPFAAADIWDPDGERHGGGLVAFADEVQHSVAAQRVGVALDLNGKAVTEMRELAIEECTRTSAGWRPAGSNELRMPVRLEAAVIAAIAR